MLPGRGEKPDCAACYAANGAETTPVQNYPAAAARRSSRFRKGEIGNIEGQRLEQRRVHSPLPVHADSQTGQQRQKRARRLRTFSCAHAKRRAVTAIQPTARSSRNAIAATSREIARKRELPSEVFGGVMEARGLPGCLQDLRWRLPHTARDRRSRSGVLIDRSSLTPTPCRTTSGQRDWIGAVLSEKGIDAAFEAEGDADAVHESAAFDLHVERPAEKIGVIVQRSDREALAVRATARQSRISFPS